MSKVRSRGEVMLEVKYLPIEELKAYENNARKHGEKDVKAIADSISEFDFNDPIAIWGDDNLIIEGHGRVLAAKRLGIKEVPTIKLDHLSDEQRRAYALAHNMTALLSFWDDEILEMELDSIESIDMDLFGFEEPEEKEQIMSEGKELDLDDFSDESFDHECQECGFRWSD